jgi:hypothetical protein
VDIRSPLLQARQVLPHLLYLSLSFPSSDATQASVCKKYGIYSTKTIVKRDGKSYIIGRHVNDKYGSRLGRCHPLSLILNSMDMMSFLGFLHGSHLAPS